MIRVRLGAVFLLLMVCPAVAQAAPVGWTRTPALSGEGVCALAASPSGDLWAGGVDGGLYLSEDGGMHWQARPIPENSLPACPLAVSPNYANDHLVIAVTDRAYASTDRGATWSPLSLPITPSAIIFSPSFGIDRTIVAAADSGPVYRSMDRGKTWTQVADWQAGLSAAGHFIVYSGTALPGGGFWLATGDGVYRSLDSGATWAWANSGLPSTRDLDPASGTSFRRIERVAAVAENNDPSDLVAALFAAGRGWFYRSHDGGRTWSQVGATLGARPTSLVSIAAPNSSMMVMGTHEEGVLVSHDDGLNWQPLATGLNDADTVALAVLPDGTIVAGGAEDGVFRLSPGATAWTSGFAGMPERDPAGVLASEGADGPLYAGTLSGVYRFSGGAWQADNAGLPGERSVAGFAAWGKGAATRRLVATASGVYQQTGDLSWLQVGSSDMRGLGAAAVAVREGPSATILAGTDNGLFWSTDGARQWHLYILGDMYVSEVAFSPSYGQTHTIYVLCNGRLERYRNHHGGVIRQSLGGSPILSFALQPGKGDHIIATTATGLYREVQGRWTLVSRGAFGEAPTIRFIHAQTALVGTVHGLLLSRDAGERWSAVATPGGAGVLTVARETARRVAVSLAGGGVWQYELP